MPHIEPTACGYRVLTGDGVSRTQQKYKESTEEVWSSADRLWERAGFVRRKLPKQRPWVD